MRPMLATRGTHVPTDCGWSHEVKWDGMRVLADTTASGTSGCSAATRTTSPSPGPSSTGARSATATCSSTARCRAQRARASRLPGAPGPDARAQRRRRGRGSPSGSPATYMVFDVLRLDGRDLHRDAAGGAARDPARPRPRATRPGRSRPPYDDGPMLFDATLAAGARGHRQQAADLALRLRRAHPELAEVRAPAPPLVRRRRLAPAGGHDRPAGRAAGRRADRRRGCSTAAGSAAASPARPSRSLTAAGRPAGRGDSPFADEVPRVDARGTFWVEPVLVVDVETHGARLRRGSGSRRTAASAPTSAPRT